MPHYMLLLRDDRETWNNLSPEEMQKAVEKYYAWRKNPFVVDGKGLNAGTGRVLRKKNGKVNVTDGPFSEGRLKSCATHVTVPNPKGRRAM